MTTAGSTGGAGDAGREAVIRLYAARLAGRDGWHLEPSVQDADGFRATLTQRRLEVAELAELESWSVRVEAGKRLELSGRFHNTAYRAGWGYDAQAGCWHAPHELDRRFPGPAFAVDRLDVSYAVPEFGWLRTAVRAGDCRTEFSMSDVYDPIPELLRWLERLANGVPGSFFMDVEGWYVDFHCFAEGEQVRFVVEEGDSDRSVTLDVRIDRIDLLAGFYCPLVTLWESDAFACAYNHWPYASRERDAWEAVWMDLSDDEDPERLTPDPIRLPRIEAALRAAGWDW